MMFVVLRGVVDELRLVVAPTVVGSGQRLLDGLPPIRLETIRSVLSPSGHLLLDSRVVGLVRDALDPERLPSVTPARP